MPKIIIIGAGAVGSSIAYELSKTHNDVTVLDQGQIGAGTTSASFSMHIATRKTPKHHFDLAMRGGQRHLELLTELGISAKSPHSWVHPAPLYEWAINDYERDLISSRVQRLNEWGYDAKWISREELSKSEPKLQPDAFADQIALYPDSYWYDAPLLARTLANRARVGGVEFKTGARVTGIATTSAGVAVKTDDGSVYDGDRVCIAAGSGAGSLAQLAGTTLPVNQIPGLVLTTEPVPYDVLSGIVLHPRVNLRRAPNGGIVLQSYSEEARLLHHGADSECIRQIQADVMSLAETLLPSIKGARIVDASVGQRPVPSDGLPIVGWLDSDRRIYTVSAHSAINLSPVLAQDSAAELGSDNEAQTLTPFRPARQTLLDPEAGEVDESAREMKRMYAESLNA